MRLLGCNCPDNITLGSNLYIRNPNSLTLGNNVYLGDNNQLYCYAKINIGKYTFFSHNCCLVAGSHETTDYSNKIKNQEINIGAGCWVGTGVTILGGVSIGKGSIIGAGSLVNKDIPKFSIAVGNPCKVIKQRVPAEIIKQPIIYNISELEET